MVAQDDLLRSFYTILLLPFLLHAPSLVAHGSPLSLKDLLQQYQHGGRFDAGEPHRVHRRDAQHKAWINSGKYQGDIDGVPAKDGHYQLPSKEVYLNAVRDKRLRWDHGVVPYLFGPGFSPQEVSVIKKSMEVYHKKTCVRFVVRTYQNDFLHIVKDYGCYSLVGKVGGRQDISLGRGCIYHEIIVHELMHTLGFWHEQSRADRDQFITIQWQNIIPGLQGQFDQIDYIYSDFLGETYDYRSVMHYDSKAFSRNGKDTIVAQTPGMTTVIGKAMDLSEGDIRKVNKLYHCQDKLTGGETDATANPNPLMPIETTTFHPPTAPPSVCTDRFLDCPFFERYCGQASFINIMKSYCPKTCNHCDRIF